MPQKSDGIIIIFNYKIVHKSEGIKLFSEMQEITNFLEITRKVQ